MESLSVGLLTSPPSLDYPKKFQTFNSKSILWISNSTSRSRHTLQTVVSLPTNEPRQVPQTLTTLFNAKTSRFLLDAMFVKSHFSFLSMGFFFPLSCFASEVTVPAATEEVSNKINLEAIVVSIDDFFNKNPFFVAGVMFIWLVAIPLGQEYFSKYKFISAIDAFRKLRDDPNYQLLDIRNKKSLDFMNSPNLKILNKSVLQVAFVEGDEEEFLRQVLENFKEPDSTSVCVLDSFDGNSIKVAELLVKNGFKEAYAIRGGIRGNKGWQDIQETLLPPSVHIYAKKKVKDSQEPSGNGAVNRQTDGSLSSVTSLLDDNPINSSSESNSGVKSRTRSSSPYPNYPDLKPPTSPTPSKPER